MLEQLTGLIQYVFETSARVTPWLQSFHNYNIINMNYLYPKQCVTLLIAEALVTIACESVGVSFTIALVVVGQILGSTALHSTKDN